jgi:hypothetical protein
MAKGFTLLTLSLFVTACAQGSPSSLAPTSATVTSPSYVSTPASGGILGWVWDDVCPSGKPPQRAVAPAPKGCVTDSSTLGPYRGDGVPAQGHPGIAGVVISLGVGQCPSTGSAETVTSPSDYSFAFTELLPGTYCVSVDPSRQPNASILGSGMWTAPDVKLGVIGVTIRIGPREYRSGVGFGWDSRFKP